MRLVDCEPVPDSFMAWAKGASAEGFTAPGGSSYRSLKEAFVGAVMSSPTGEWAVLGVTAEGSFAPDGRYCEPGDGECVPEDYQVVYLTQNPPIGGADTEVVQVGSTWEGHFYSHLETATVWAGGLLALGEEAAAAALACVS
jgi:hypothetical protein